MRCKLERTSNPSLQAYIGAKGELTKNPDGSYHFKMDNKMSINTNISDPNTTLGDVNYLPSPEVSFKTRSGTLYVFENIERERAVDGCFRQGNQYLGFDNEPDITDEY